MRKFNMSDKNSGGGKSVNIKDGASVPIMVKKGAGTPAKPKPAPKPNSK
jgi:hypothetical protein